MTRVPGNSKSNSTSTSDKATDGTANGATDGDGSAARSEFKAALFEIENIRLPLLDLHKTLLEAERATYETVHGPIQGQGAFLHLVMTDPWFDWLHRISQMVVRIDEIADAKPESANDYMNLAQSAKAVLRDARALFRPKEEASSASDREFTARYKAVLKRSSATVMAHSSLLKSLFAT